MKNQSIIGQIVSGLKDMCYIWAREMRNTVHDEGMLLFCILVPLGYPLLYSWIYNNEVVREVPTAVVDLSCSHASRQFVRSYDASPDTRVAYFCDNLGQARRLVEEQAVRGILYIPSDFNTRINRGEQAHVGVYCDMSLMLTYKAIYQTAQAVASAMNSKIQVAQSGGVTQRDEEVGTQPLDCDAVPIFNATGGYGNALLPGVLILILQQTLLLGIGLSAGTARENSRYRELVPFSRHYNGIFRIVLGKSLCYLMIYAVMSAYVTLCVPRFFHFTTLSTAGALAGLMLPFLLAAIFFGMTLSCVVRYRENVLLLVVFTSVPLLFMSGISWPQSNIPGVWRGVACLFPSTFGIRGFLRVNSMGATLADIRPECTALWIQTVAYFFTACMVYRYQIRHMRDIATRHVGGLREKVRNARSKKNADGSRAARG